MRNKGIIRGEREQKLIRGKGNEMKQKRKKRKRKNTKREKNRRIARITENKRGSYRRRGTGGLRGGMRG